MRKFWMVWNDGGGAPVAKHWREQDAKNESQRLAMRCPGQVFVVLKSIDACKMHDPVEWASRIDDNELPF